ncbi:MAG: tetratricopeptide repeat protein [Planctomycetota bacterium]
MATAFGKYTLEKKLGQGGMGAVYLAVDPDLNRKVALKIITSNDPELLERFQREASAVAKLKHPNIIQVYEVGLVSLPSATGGSARKQHYFTMDYVEGISLEKLITSPNKPSIQNIARIILQVASALHYAHSQKVIHRDIKPANILITKQGAAYIVDFGLAKQLTGLDRTLTMAGTTIGTPNYMSPEQAQGKKDEIDPRSDIFSLGATLYHCLTGRLPFSGDEIYQVLNDVINNDPPGPSTIVRIISKDLETICMKCLNKDKSKRYQTAGALAKDLQQYLKGGQIVAKPVSVISKIRIKATKNKAASLAIIGAAVILIIVIISLLVSSSNKKQLIAQYRQEAEQAFLANQYDEAKVACNKLLALSPQDEAIQSLLKKCEKITKAQETKKQQEEAQAKEAAAKAQKAVELRNRAKAILDQATVAPTPEQKIQLAQEALEVDPTFGDACQVIGYAYEDKRDYAKAVEAFTKAIKLTPTLAYSYYERAIITVNTYKKPEDAIPDFNKVLELDPNSDIGYFAKGSIEDNQKDYNKAISSYNKAIELNPNYAEAHNNRGLVYYNKAVRESRQGGNTYRELLEQAIKDYAKAIELNPNLEYAYNNRGEAYLNKGELDRAIQDYDKAIELNPNDAKTYSNRGNAYDDKDQIEQAIKDFDKAIELNPDLAEVYSNRGITYAKKGQLDQAINDFDKAIELNPNLADAYCNRGIIYANKGQIEQSIKDFDKAIELDPNLADAYYNRGLIYASNKNYRQAIADWETVLKLVPNHPRAEKMRKTIEEMKNQLK